MSRNACKLVDDLLVLLELVVFVTSSRLQKIDQLSLTVRSVDIDGTIHKEFLGFLSLERITDEAFISAILDVLPKWNLKIKNCRGQGDNRTDVKYVIGLQQYASTSSRRMSAGCLHSLSNPLPQFGCCSLL